MTPMLARFLKKFARRAPCACAACRDLRRQDAVETARFDHPWRSALEDTWSLVWWLLRAALWTVWTVALANSVYSNRWPY
jgi:hypothetical protein